MVDGTLLNPAPDVQHDQRRSERGHRQRYVSGLTISRKITVPNTGGQDSPARWTPCQFHTGAVTTTVQILGNLGSDAATTVFATSDGDATPEPGDLWIGTDDATDGGGTPAVIYYVHGPGALPAHFGRPCGRQHPMDVQSHRAGRANRPAGLFHHRGHDPGGRRGRRQRLGDPCRFRRPGGAFTAGELQSLVNFVAPPTTPPVLTPASPSMGSTDEDTPIAVGLSGTFINHGPVTTTITDADSGAIFGGIALVGTTGHGVWSYSLDGTSYSPVGTVSTGSALLLPATARLRYTPDMKNGETAAITYRAWDQTYGTPGTDVDTTINGDPTAFSSATDIASLVVTGLNDAPVLTIAHPSLGATTKDLPVTINLAGTFINHGPGTTTITDVDNGAVIGGIALSAATGHGVWSYSLDGSAFSPVGRVEPRFRAAVAQHRRALLYARQNRRGNGHHQLLRLGHDQRVAGGHDRHHQLWRRTTAISLDWDIASLRVNDAPLLTPASPSMGVTNEDTTFTTALSGTFINNGPGTTTITDIDAGAVVGGIARWASPGAHVVVLARRHGLQCGGTVSAGSALLLPATAQLRYAPDLMNGETAVSPTAAGT